MENCVYVYWVTCFYCLSFLMFISRFFCGSCVLSRFIRLSGLCHDFVFWCYSCINCLRLLSSSLFYSCCLPVTSSVSSLVLGRFCLWFPLITSTVPLSSVPSLCVVSLFPGNYPEFFVLISLLKDTFVNNESWKGFLSASEACIQAQTFFQFPNHCNSFEFEVPCFNVRHLCWIWQNSPSAG